MGAETQIENILKKDRQSQQEVMTMRRSNHIIQEELDLRVKIKTTHIKGPDRKKETNQEAIRDHKMIWTNRKTIKDSR